MTHAEPVVNVSYTSLTRKEKKNRSVRTGRYCFFGNEPYMQSIFDTPYRDVVPPCNPVRIMTLKLSGGVVTVGISFRKSVQTLGRCRLTSLPNFRRSCRKTPRFNIYGAKSHTKKNLHILTCYLDSHHAISFYYDVALHQVKLLIFYNVQTTSLNI